MNWRFWQNAFWQFVERHSNGETCCETDTAAGAWRATCIEAVSRVFAGFEFGLGAIAAAYIWVALTRGI